MRKKLDPCLNAGAEYQNRENKKSLSEERAAIETVAAFATAQGGTIYFGIDPNGNRVGVQMGHNTLENLANAIKSHTEPPQYPIISVEGNDQDCIVSIKVEESPVKPVFAYNVPFKRVGRTNQKLSRGECHRLMYQTRRQSWDALPLIGLNANELERPRMEAFMRRAGVSPEMSSETLLETLALIVDEKPVNAAALLFCAQPDRYIPSAFVQCARFDGNTSAHFLDEQTVYGDVISQIEGAVAFVRRNTRQSIRITGNPQHERVPEYPEEAVREAINNAVCHRDYLSRGNAQIRIYDDRLEVWNPGALPPELHLEDLYAEHASHPHNPLLAEALHRARVIEHWGTGTIRILRACETAGMPHPEFILEQGIFKVRFPGLGQRLFLDLTELPERQRRAVAHVQEHGKITTQEYSHLVHIGERAARRHLGELVNQKVFAFQDAGPKSHYILHPSYNIRTKSSSNKDSE